VRGPSEAVGVDLAILIDESDETLAKVVLKSVLDIGNALLRPSGVDLGVSFLQK
jgi:hypothetical protein